MNNTTKVLTALLAIFLVGVASETIIYYSGLLNEKDSQIASLTQKVAQLDSEAANFTIMSMNFGYVQANLTAANIVIANLTNQKLNLNNEIQNLKGQITDMGSQVENLNAQVENLSDRLAELTTANVVTALGIVEIPTTYQSQIGSNPQDLTAPYNHLYIQGSVTNSGAGTAFNAGLHIVAYASDGTTEINMTVPMVNIAQFGTDANTMSYAHQSASSLNLTSLAGETNTPIYIDIFHEGTVSSWTLTPVWTNFP
ncbi:MAG TPA: hypothetical protein VMD05_00325 [Candidatus Nanoarchaeia archaeon]|nr:hypothetical protein [Candidatus Nanoarchaeia archaeon]